MDTSAIIEVKRQLKIGEQWPFLQGLTLLLKAGTIAFPPQVRSEMVHARYPDAPGAWTAASIGTERHAPASDATLAEVLAAAPRLVDPLSEDEDADPYVVAMALEIQRRLPGTSVAVVTADVVDRLPLKSSLASACGLVGVECWSVEDFFVWAKTEIEWATGSEWVDGDEL